jgi:hypothetical protein
MTTYEKKEIITEERTYNKPSLHDVERTDDLTTEKQHLQNQNPFEKTERDTEIRHVDHEKDRHNVGTTEHVHEHIHTTDQKYGKNEHVGTTEHHNVGKTEHVGKDHNRIGKTEHVGTADTHGKTENFVPVENVDERRGEKHVGIVEHGHNIGKTDNYDKKEHIGTSDHHHNTGKTDTYVKEHDVGKTEHIRTSDHHNTGKTDYVDTSDKHTAGKTKNFVPIEDVNPEKGEKHVGIIEHGHRIGKTTDDHNVGKTEKVDTTEHHVGKTKKDKTHKSHKVGKKVKSDHVMNDNEDKPSTKEKVKNKLHNLGEKVGLVKPETHVTTITEELNPDGTKKIIKEERSYPEHVGFGKPETELIRTEEIVDANGNRTILTKEGRENVGFMTQPETHKTKVVVEKGLDGRDKIVTERRDHPEHVGFFLPETAKIKTEEFVERDGTRTIKTKEGTDHMGLATQPETLKTYARVEGEGSDGSRLINKEIRTSPEQMAIKKTGDAEVVKIKEHVDPYGQSRSVEVIEGGQSRSVQDHGAGALGTRGTNTVGDHNVNTAGNYGAGNVGIRSGTSNLGNHDTNVGINERNDPGYGKGAGYTGTGVGGTGVDNTNTTYKHPA